MKTMSEQQFKNFVMSGFIPTSNEDIANVQDTIGYLSYEFLAVMATDSKVRHNLQTLIEKVCDNHMWETITKMADNMIAQEVRIINLRNRMKEIESQLKDAEGSFDHEAYCEYYGFEK